MNAVLMVVPTLGLRNELLREALRSIRHQEGVQAHVVVVSPSGRGVELIAAEHGADFVIDPGAGGQSGAINAGLGAATDTDKYFAWLCDDDLLAPDALSVAVAALQAAPDASAAYGWCDYIDLNGQVVFRSRAGRWAARIIGWGPNLIPQPGSLARLRAVRDVGGIDESATVTMDLDLFLRLRKVGRLLAIERTLAAFRWHDGSLTVSGETFSMDQADEVRRKHMPRAAAFVYPLSKWPGRWALRFAKGRVSRRTARLSTAAVGSEEDASTMSMKTTAVRHRVSLVRRFYRSAMRRQRSLLDRLPTSFASRVALPFVKHPPLNGQAQRIAIAREVAASFGIERVIETGTFRGATTRLFDDIFGKPVASVEACSRFHAYAARRLRQRRNVDLTHGDSRTFLRQLAADPDWHRSRVFIYLDAHWEHDLPLTDELRIIASTWTHAIVMVDDFEVPGDAGYGFDDYGPSGALTTSLFPVEVRDWRLLYPAAPSHVETGRKRGSCVLVSPAMPDVDLRTLREAS